jgi:hypothetical protein
MKAGKGDDDIQFRPLTSDGANIQEVLILPKPGEAKLYRRVKGGWVELREVRKEELS